MSSSHIKLAARVPPEAAGRRLDQALASLFPDYSRTRLKSWIDEGKVLVDGRPLRPRDRLVGGEDRCRGDVRTDDASDDG